MNHSSLAELVHEKGLKKTIKKELESKYINRINYLVGANNELSRLLEQYEKNLKKYISFADNTLLKENKGFAGEYEEGDDWV